MKTKKRNDTELLDEDFMDDADSMDDFVDVDINYSSEEDEDENKRAKLVDSIVAMGNSKSKKINPRRTESSLEVSEFGIKDAKNDKVKLHELALSLGHTGAHMHLKKQIFKSKRKQKLLPTPLTKPEADKIKREVSYNKVKREVSKWDGIVEKNRSAATMVYPLKQPSVQIQTCVERAKHFKPVTPLEMEIAALLHGSKNFLKDDKLITEAEAAAFKAMSLEEALEKRKELQKMRSIESYMASKAKRQNKIKSKSYHRLLKKERTKNAVKEFENLKESDPEAAIRKLDEINQQRIEERMSLRHRGTGKWAKHLAIRAKYDTQSRHALSEQLQKNRELTAKKSVQEDPEDKPVKPENTVIAKFAASQEYNPWLHGRKVTLNNEEEEQTNEKSHFTSVWKKEREEIEKLKKQKKEPSDVLNCDGISKKKKRVKTKEIEIEELATEDVNDEVHPLEKFNDNTAYLNETADGQNDTDLVHAEEENVLELVKANIDSNEHEHAKKLEVDPQNFVTIKTRKLKSAIPDNIIGIDEEQGEDDHIMTIEEAFADDDVVRTFREDKQSAVDDGKPKDIDNFLPGWGSWGGKNIKPNPRKRKRFLVKAPPAAIRKDSNMKDVFINEGKESEISKLQVSEVPFPFTNAYEYEKTLQAPVGRLWNSESAFKQLTIPKVITKLGKIIEPIDADALINKKPPKKVARKKSHVEKPKDKKTDD